MSASIDQAFQSAILHYEAGHLLETSQICQQILSQKSDHADALHLLGVLARRAGNLSQAQSLQEQAIKLNPSSAQYRNSLGITLLGLGQVQRAIDAFEAALRLSPAHPDALNNLGSALLRNTQPEQAAAAFNRAIQLRPSMIEPRLGLAASLREMGRLLDAVTAYQQALLIQPGHARAHIELGHVLLRVGELDAAVDSYGRAIVAAPKEVDAYSSLGNALTTLERFDEAEEMFRTALKIDPSAGAVWNNLGNMFQVQARADEALDAYQQAVACNPRLGAAFSNLGNALKDRGKLPEAIAAHRRAVELNPTSAAVHSNLAYTACFDPDHDAAQILAEARLWADRHETPLLATHRPHDNDRDPGRKLRIGYVSADFRAHVIGRNVLPILEQHDRGSFEIHCFSTLIRHDRQTAQFVQAAERWHESGMLSESELAEKIRAEKIDILVDLSLHISGNRLLTFARKPAPVQVTWAGYPGTTGLRSIDYRITDPYLDPPGETEAYYSEACIRLPHSFWCYRPMPASPESNPLPAASAGFVTFGCLNNPAKATAKSLDLWSDVLRAVPNSRLRMLAPAGSVRGDVTNYFHRKGIEHDRIGFVEPVRPEEHLSRYHLIDISLDPLPYTGHTSTLDSLWMGVPVVTLSGNTSVVRGSVTALSNVGLTELIAHTSQQYVDKSVELAGDLSRLAEIRRTLRGQMRASPLCDEKQFTRDLESAYRQIWRTWCGTLPPD